MKVKFLCTNHITSFLTRYCLKALMNKQYKVNKRESRQIKDNIWTKMLWQPDTRELQTLTRAMLPEPKPNIILSPAAAPDV